MDNLLAPLGCVIAFKLNNCRFSLMSTVLTFLQASQQTFYENDIMLRKNYIFYTCLGPQKRIVCLKR